MIKLSEEGMSKAKTVRNLTITQVVDAKDQFLKEMKSAISVNT